MYENLRRIKKERGMSCEKVAQILGIVRTTYTKKELGTISFSLAEAKELSDLFGESIEEIFLLLRVPPDNLLKISSIKHLTST